MVYQFWRSRLVSLVHERCKRLDLGFECSERRLIGRRDACPRDLVALNHQMIAIGLQGDGRFRFA